MAWKFNPHTGCFSYYESSGEPGPHDHTESEITDLTHLALGELSTNAYRGDRGKTAYDHSQVSHAPASADETASNETSHADVVVDGDFSSNGIMLRTGVGTYGIQADNSTNWDTAYTHSQASHASTDADNTAANETSHSDVLVETDVDDTPVNGATTDPISSNWAFDHNADANAHHNESHTVASHSDTTATGAELNELTDGSTTTLHSHSGGGGGATGFYSRYDESGSSESTFATDQDFSFDTAGQSLTGVSYASSEFTIASDLNGKYALISAAISFQISNRLEVQCSLQVDTGGGYAELARLKNYATRDSNQNEGSVLVVWPVLLATSDKYKIVYNITRDGTTACARDTGKSCYFSMLVI